MESKDFTKLIKSLVAVELLIVFASIVVSFYLEQYLPLSLQQYLSNDVLVVFSSQLLNVIYYGTLFSLLLIYIVGIVGILNGKVWGKYAYLTSLVIGFLVTPFLGHTVDHAFSGVLTDIQLALSGFIACLLLFTPSVFSNTKPKTQAVMEEGFVQ